MDNGCLVADDDFSSPGFAFNASHGDNESSRFCYALNVCFN